MSRAPTQKGFLFDPSMCDQLRIATSWRRSGSSTSVYSFGSDEVMLRPRYRELLDDATRQEVVCERQLEKPQFVQLGDLQCEPVPGVRRSARRLHLYSVRLEVAKLHD